MAPVMALPSGTITFLFTDIKGSTRLWEQFPEGMRAALARHDALLRAAIESHNGYVFKTVGDAFCAAFSGAAAALQAALDIQFALQNETWGETGPILVRMGLHSGEAEERDNDYFGPTLNRVARLQSVAYAGQILLSQATYELVRDHLPPAVSLQSLGQHRLADLNRPEHLHMVVHPDLSADFPTLKTLDSHPNNLPIQLTSFIGREKEMADVTALLATHRLVTLLGTGGTGKTRLSLQVGAEMLERFPDGVYFIELAPLREGALVVQTIASELGVREEAGRPLLRSLIDFLKPRRLLLILDNCEHLVADCAQAAQSLLQSCPSLSILASSREGFKIPGETLYRVPSLRLPDPRADVSIASLSQYEAVRLFIDRAASILTHFAVTNANAPALAELCVRLDGIPLAIELAAARVRSLSVEEINSKLDNVFRLLTGGSRTALPRQQTLRALIDWSYDLLTDAEKTLLARLSVFIGGWTLEAAEAICAGDEVEDWEILDLLTGLADRSLVVVEEQDGHTRYRLLETIRQYARERLRERGEMEAISERHRACFEEFATETKRRLVGAEQQTSLQTMESEHGNLRAALEFALTHRPESALPLAAAQGLFWYLGGFLREGRESLERALAAYTGPNDGSDLDLRADACYQVGRLCVEQHDFKAAQTFLENGLALFRETGHQKGAANILNSLGTLAVLQNRYGVARTYLEESLFLQREVGYQAGIAGALINLGNLLYDLGDFEQALAHYIEGQAYYEQTGQVRGVATSLINRSNMAFAQGEIHEARLLAERSLVLGQQIKDDWYIAYSQCSLAFALIEEGDYATAAGLAQEALLSLRKVGDMGQAATSLSLLTEIAIRQQDFATARVRFQEILEAERDSHSPRETIILIEQFLGYLVAAHPGDAASAEHAARLSGATEAARAALEMPLPPIYRESRQAQRETLIAVLGAAAYTAAHESGALLSLEDALAEIERALA